MQRLAVAAAIIRNIEEILQENMFIISIAAKEQAMTDL